MCALSSLLAARPQGHDFPRASVHACSVSGASMPSSRIRVPAISMVSPSITHALPTIVLGGGGRSRVCRRKMRARTPRAPRPQKLEQTERGCAPGEHGCARRHIFLPVYTPIWPCHRTLGRAPHTAQWPFVSSCSDNRSTRQTAAPASLRCLCAARSSPRRRQSRPRPCRSAPPPARTGLRRARDQRRPAGE